LSMNFQRGRYGALKQSCATRKSSRAQARDRANEMMITQKSL
jgi:hypothetical protein